jgi:antitoxin PrlF
MAFEKALFRAHPEFAAGPLEAEYIGPGHLLVRAIGSGEGTSPDDDPVLGAYLAFLERDMAAHPERLQALSPDLLALAEELVEGIVVDPEADLGDSASID